MTTTPPTVPFATITDLEYLGRDTDSDDLGRISRLLGDASQLVLDEIPAAIARPPETLRRIVCAMVLRVLESGAPVAGVETSQFGVGPFQESYKWANPTGDLYLTKAERRQLRGPRRAFMIDTAPPDSGSEYPVGDPWP